MRFSAHSRAPWRALLRPWRRPADGRGQVLGVVGIGLLLVTTLLAAYFLAITGWQDLDQMMDQARERRQVRTAQLAYERTLSLFKDLETGARGYLLTGRDEYLEPYDLARTQLPLMFAGLKSDFAYVPPGFTWETLESQFHRRLAIAAELVQMRKRAVQDSAREVALLDEGRVTMELIRDDFARLGKHHGGLVDQYDAEIGRLRDRGGQRALWGSLIITGLLTGTIFLLWRESARRRQVEQDLQDLNVQLESQVDQRTLELQEARDRLATFAERREQDVENERRRMAREVHDQVGQVFTAIKLILNSVPDGLYPDEQRQALDKALEIGIGTTRRISTELRPPLLDEMGLKSALEFFLEKLLGDGALRWQIDVREPNVLEAATQLVLFRLTQEAVTNVLRHAQGATRLELRGWREGATYHYEIEDNGRGFEPHQVRPDAFGLASMRERVGLAGGRFEIVSGRARQGTLIRVELPIKKTA